MASLMKSWEIGFRRRQPQVQFLDTLKGAETAQAGLYTGVADLALMDRERLPGETYGLYKRRRYFPLEITVATGSYDLPNKAFALAVFVNRDNPTSRLTMKQLDGIFGEARSGGWDDYFRWHSEVARGAEENIRTWGQLGLTGEWKDKPIHVYGYPADVHYPSNFAPGARFFFGREVLRGGDKWTPALREFEKSEDMMQALDNDPYGIAYTCLCYATRRVKPIALGRANGAAFTDITRQTVASRAYPLTRSVYIYIDRAPDQPVDPRVKEFLSYILSREGQQAVARDGGYLPLTADVVREQLKKLE